MSMVFFISVQINKPWIYITMCKTAISGVKDGEEVLMDCDYPS